MLGIYQRSMGQWGRLPSHIIYHYKHIQILIHVGIMDIYVLIYTRPSAPDNTPVCVYTFGIFSLKNIHDVYVT